MPECRRPTRVGNVRLKGYEIDVHKLLDEFVYRALDGAPLTFETFKAVWKEHAFSFATLAVPPGHTLQEYIQCLFATALDRLDTPSPLGRQNLVPKMHDPKGTNCRKVRHMQDGGSAQLCDFGECPPSFTQSDVEDYFLGESNWPTVASLPSGMLDSIRCENGASPVWPGLSSKDKDKNDKERNEGGVGGFEKQMLGANNAADERVDEVGGQGQQIGQSGPGNTHGDGNCRYLGSCNERLDAHEIDGLDNLGCQSASWGALVSLQGDTFGGALQSLPSLSGLATESLKKGPSHPRGELQNVPDSTLDAPDWKGRLDEVLNEVSHLVDVDSTAIEHDAMATNQNTGAARGMESVLPAESNGADLAQEAGKDSSGLVSDRTPAEEGCTERPAKKSRPALSHRDGQGMATCDGVVVCDSQVGPGQCAALEGKGQNDNSMLAGGGSPTRLQSSPAPSQPTSPVTPTNSLCYGHQQDHHTAKESAAQQKQTIGRGQVCGGGEGVGDQLDVRPTAGHRVRCTNEETQTRDKRSPLEEHKGNQNSEAVVNKDDRGGADCPWATDLRDDICADSESEVPGSLRDDVPFEAMVAAIFAVYSIYYCQVLEPHTLVYLPVELLERLTALVPKLQERGQLEALQMLKKLFADEAFLFGAVRRPPSYVNRKVKHNEEEMSAIRDIAFHIKSTLKGLADFSGLISDCNAYDRARVAAVQQQGERGEETNRLDLFDASIGCQLGDCASTRYCELVKMIAEDVSERTKEMQSGQLMENSRNELHRRLARKAKEKKARGSSRQRGKPDGLPCPTVRRHVGTAQLPSKKPSRKRKVAPPTAGVALEDDESSLACLPPAARKAVQHSLLRRQAAAARPQGMPNRTQCTGRPQPGAPGSDPVSTAEAHGSVVTADFEGLLISGERGGAPSGKCSRGAGEHPQVGDGRSGQPSKGGPIEMGAVEDQILTDVDAQLEAFRAALADGDAALEENPPP
ncbi:unnamed protein product [Ostreobium quekettii]|uniref:Uncharacterized protein n=1 Tax=Ostreobium quekettii TaxID=121088 RepID=A0A8S1IXT9_9CHLO|nr:unnamed protein product [Ostreobium quekettii]